MLQVEVTNKESPEAHNRKGITMEKKQVRLGIVGLGNVPLALLRYLTEETAKRTLARHSLKIIITGIATGRRGNAIDPEGLDINAVLGLGKEGLVSSLNRGSDTKTSIKFVRAVPADILFVASPASVPSLEEIETAFERGMHVVTSNKTPIATAYRRLSEEASRRHLELRYGATVLAGYPPWRHFFESAPGLEITEIEIVVNATSNKILTMMLKERKRFDEGVSAAQKLGIAERDPSDDVDGHDTQKKIVILANALMGGNLTPEDVPTEGIRGVTVEALEKADQSGAWIHLLGHAWRDDKDDVRADVKPTEVHHPFFTQMRGTSMGLYFTTEAADFGFRLDLGAGDRAIMATAAGVFEDILSIGKNLKR